MWAGERYNKTELPFLDQLMINFSIDVNNQATDNSPAGIGNRVAPIAFARFNDSNEFNNLRSSRPNDPFGDTHNYGTKTQCQTIIKD